MTTYPGVVTLDHETVPVTLGIGIGKVTLVAGDLEIGEWSDADCIIRPDGEGQWLIEAEEETLFFLPDDPSQFAIGLEGEEGHGKHEASAATVDPEDPGPKAMTMVGFYLLAGVTAVLGLWALISLFM